MHADVTVALRRLAESCEDAAGFAGNPAARYAALRAEALDLNDRHGWATADEFATQIPTLEALSAIESLDRSFGNPPVERGTEARVTEALIQLAGWATGVRLAHETLREMDSR